MYVTSRMLHNIILYTDWAALVWGQSLMSMIALFESMLMLQALHVWHRSMWRSWVAVMHRALRQL